MNSNCNNSPDNDINSEIDGDNGSNHDNSGDSDDDNDNNKYGDRNSNNNNINSNNNNRFQQNPKSSNKNFAIFSDSIPRGMKMKNLNEKINGGRMHLKAFRGAKCWQLDHHVIPSLKEYHYDGAIVHVGINDLLRCKNERERLIAIKNLPDNVMKITKTCQNYNIRKIFISEIQTNKKIDVNIVDINQKLKEICLQNNFEFIEHRLITPDHLWTDGIHLLDSGKEILGNNFVDSINDFLEENYFL